VSHCSCHERLTNGRKRLGRECSPRRQAELAGAFGPLLARQGDADSGAPPSAAERGAAAAAATEVLRLLLALPTFQPLLGERGHSHAERGRSQPACVHCCPCTSTGLGQSSKVDEACLKHASAGCIGRAAMQPAEDDRPKLRLAGALGCVEGPGRCSRSACDPDDLTAPAVCVCRGRWRRRRRRGGHDTCGECAAAD
jgi:hypothetical protein